MSSSASSSPPLTSTLSMKTKSDGKKSLELSPSKDSNLIYKNQHLQSRSMSLSSSQRRRTHATPDEFDLTRLSAMEQQHKHQHVNRHQGRFSKTEVIIKDGPKGSGKGKGDDGFKCSAFCICLPGFGNKAKKAVKARKGETKMDHPLDPMMMSSTFSFEIFERNSGINNENKEDESISSYFELPLSQILKYSTGDGAQAPVIAGFVLDKDIKGEHF